MKEIMWVFFVDDSDDSDSGDSSDDGEFRSSSSFNTTGELELSVAAATSAALKSKKRKKHPDGEILWRFFNVINKVLQDMCIVK